MDAKRNEESKVGNWAESEIEKGTSRNGFLCCNQSSGTRCQPFPECCNCENKKKATKAAEKGNNHDLESHLENIPIVEMLQN